MLYFSFDKKRFEEEFQSPGIPGSGMDSGELADALKFFLEGKKFNSHLEEHTAAFCWLLENIRIGVSPEDLFVTLGVWGRKPIEKVLSIPRQWRVTGELCPETAGLRENFNHAGHGYLFWDFAHSVPDWETILAKGFPGLLARAEEAFQRFKAEKKTITPEQEDFFRSVIKEYRQILSLLDRIIQWAEKVNCQPGTLEALKTLRQGPPRSFYDAMLLIWLFYQLSEYGDCIQTRSFGNLDLMLYPYYRRDLESGKFTKDDIRQIICNFYAKVSGMKYLFGHPFYLGGTLPDGSSGFNELTALLLEEYGRMGIYDPKIQIKVAENTPTAFIDQALELIRTGRNSIVFVGEPCIRKSMTRLGYSAEEARRAVIKGCYEYCAPGAVETAPVVFNTPRIFLEILKQNSEAASFEELFSATLAGFRKVIDDSMKIANDFEKYLDYVNPAPLFSGASDTALAGGADGYGKCARYNNSNFWFSGPVTVVDSLIMIRKYVYELKKLSLPQLIEILDRNWEGAEELQRQIRQDPDHFGNNRPSDAIAVEFLETLASFINKRPNSRGGICTAALHAADWFIKFGRRVEATPDGRSAGEELTKNISPRQGGNFTGAPALISSVLKLDPSSFAAGFPVDVMLHPSVVAGREGLLALRSLMMTWIRKGGEAIHFNIFSSKILKEAQRHPERYADLQVRVCGWNVLWNNLSPAEQEKYLEQAEANEANM